MFVQVIQGHVADAEQVHATLDRWARDLAPGATGWLGTTAGVTDDGRFIAIARFDSPDAAQRNSDRGEQGDWWTEAAQLFTDDAVFHDSTQVDIDLAGDPDTAGFVQVIQGRTSNPARVRELMSQDSAEWAAFRPDVLGSLGAGYDDGAYTTALYFISEQDAREGERKQPPAELQEQMKELDGLSEGPPDFLDLKRPWLYSPS